MARQVFVEPGRSPDYSPGPGVIWAPSPSLNPGSVPVTALIDKTRNEPGRRRDHAVLAAAAKAIKARAGGGEVKVFRRLRDRKAYCLT